MSSKRQYLTQTELAEYADITITDSAEADDQISQAEEIIDTYVGTQQKFYMGTLEGLAVSGTTTTIQMEIEHQEVYEADYFIDMWVEIIGGTNKGERRKITGSTKAGVLTVETAFSSAISSDSLYKIYQLGKFPRYCDVTYYTNSAPYKYYKSIPEAVKRATAAQVEFNIEMGSKYFATDKSELAGESIGDYSYQNRGGSFSNKLIAPKAKMLLRGIRQIGGTIIT